MSFFHVARGSVSAALRRGGGSPPVPDDPQTIYGAGLTHWWHGGAGLTINTTPDPDIVTAWADVIASKSAPATSTEEPVVGTDALGRQCPSFPIGGADVDGMRTSSFPDPLHCHDGTGGIFFAVFYLDATGAIRTIVDSNRFTTGQTGITLGADATHHSRVIVGNGGGTAAVNFTGASAMSTSAWHTLLCRHGTDLLASSDDWEVWRDGTKVGNGNYAAAPNAGAGGLNVALGGVSRATTTLRLGGPLSEVGFIDGVGTDEQLTDLLAWLEYVRTGVA